jgi:uncharacterized caspase-like protein
MFEHGYALLIGIDQNKTPKLALPIVKKDVTRLKEILTHPERCGYPEDNVLMLTGTEATREKILDGLDWLKAKLDADPDPNQTAFIYYSGHGHRETSGETFLIPYDTRLPLRLGALSASDFAASIDAIRPQRLLVVLDCCHAEGVNVKDAEESTVTSAAVTPDTPGMQLLLKGDSRAVLSSSRGSQESYIRLDNQMSVFTYHLVEALTGHVDRPDWPEVTVAEVMDYVGRKVPETSQTEHSVVQEPVFRYEGTAFPIALVLGGKGVQKGMAPPDPLAPLPKVQGKLKIGDLDGDATNVEVGKMRRGEINAEAEVEKVNKDGKFVNVKIKELG